MTVAPMPGVPAEETLIDALRGCQQLQELKDLEQRLLRSRMPHPCSTGSAICREAALVQGAGRQLLSQLHNGEA